MARFSRKRSNKVRLTNRLGSRRSRFLIALAIFLVACATYLTVAPGESNQTNYLVAMIDLPSNSQLNQTNSMAVALDLGDQANSYLRADAKTSAAYLTKPVRAGELIPVSALDRQNLIDCVNLKVNLNMPLSRDIHRGDVIDIWSAQANSSQTTLPSQIASEAELIYFTERTDALSQSSTELEVCISPAEIRSVVNALAQKQFVIAVLSQ